MSRTEVYELIDGERAYQESKWPDDGGVSSQKQTPLHFISYMQVYLTNAVGRLAGTSDPSYEMLSDAIRKVTALGVASMEKFGAPAREGF